jgi:hypothetical protein
MTLPSLAAYFDLRRRRLGYLQEVVDAPYADHDLCQRLYRKCERNDHGGARKLEQRQAVEDRGHVQRGVVRPAGRMSGESTEREYIGHTPGRSVGSISHA